MWPTKPLLYQKATPTSTIIMTLREHYVVLLHSLQVDPVLPLLHAEGLLTKSEYDKLQSPEMLALQGTARCDQLLRWLPNKGRNYFTKFCMCIGRSGQMDLLRRIGFDLSLIPDGKTCTCTQQLQYMYMENFEIKILSYFRTHSATVNISATPTTGTHTHNYHDSNHTL